MKNKDSFEVLNILQLLFLVFIIILIVKIIFTSDYTTYTYFSIISFIVSLIYFLAVGFFKASVQLYGRDKAFHLRGIYLFAILIFTILIAISFVCFIEIYENKKLNDILALLTLGLTISTPYLTNQINEKL